MKRIPLHLFALIMGCTAPLPLMAEPVFPAPEAFKGRLRVESGTPGQPIYPGGSARFVASGLQAGQKLWLQRGPAVLNSAPLTADDKGAVAFDFTLPEAAATGLHPIVAVLEDPSMTTTVDLKISAPLDWQGAEGWQIREAQITAGLYQSAWSPAAQALFLTGADFSGAGSELVKLNPDTLEVLARVVPKDFPAEQKPEKKGGGKGFALAPAGVYGLGLDDSLGRVWVTNTPDNTIAVYDRTDLSLVKQFAPGTVYHAREVLVDSQTRQAFVSSSASSNVYVFDSEGLEKKAVIEIRSASRGGDFYVMNLAHNPARAELYVTSRISNELAVIDTHSLAVKRVLPLPGAKNATGVAVDPVSGRLFIAAQDSDNLLILNGETGEVEQTVTVGAGALSVTWDAHNALAWVASRGAGSLSAVTPQGELVAHLPGGSYANHVTTDGAGRIFAVNKSLGPQDPAADRLRVIRKAE